MPAERGWAMLATVSGTVRVGCSGWAYPGWRGVVYPPDAPQRSWFALYAARFDTVELNTTFYRLPRPLTVDGWARQAPEGFTYAVKLGQYCTHRKRLADPDQWLPNHLDRVDRLAGHLGPNLVQLPPRWSRDVERLDGFLTAAPDTIRWAVEVRDPSWLHDDVLACLARHRAALCIHDLIDRHPWELTTTWTYLRFHGPAGPAGPYHGRYGPERLREVAARLGRWLADGVDVWAYFNNDHDGHAVADAESLRDALA